MKRLQARTFSLALLIGALACLTLSGSCQQKRDWQGVWADIAPEEAAQPQTAPAAETEKAAENPAVPLPPTATEISAAAAAYLFDLKTSDTGKLIGRGVLLKPASGLALAYTVDYKGNNATAEFAGKSCTVQLSGFDAYSGMCLARLDCTFELPALSPASAVTRGDELLIVAASGADAALTVETRVAQSGNPAATAAPVFTSFSAARNLSGGLAFRRDGAPVGVAFVPAGSDLTALYSGEYLLGRCAALAELPPPVPAPACPANEPCLTLEKWRELAALETGKPVQNQPAETPQTAWLGAGVIELNAAWAKKNGVTHEKGLYIKEVRAGSPLEAAGVKAGDMLLEIGGQPLETRQQLASAMLGLRPGVPASVKTIAADGRIMTLAVTPAEKK